MLKLQTFDSSYVRARQTGVRLSILLGNGFSIGACPDFVDAGLWRPFEEHLAQQGLQPGPRFDNQPGPEQVPIVQSPQAVQWPSKQTANPDTARSKALVDAVSRVHPEGRQEVSEEMLCGAARFMSSFDDVFTTNYDLLAYWVGMHLLGDECGSHVGLQQFEDGFRPTKSESPDWEPLLYHAVGSSPQFGQKMIHYLHGALHLFQVATVGGGAVTMKLARGAKRTIPRLRSGSVEQMRTPLSLLEQVKDQIRSDWYPLCVVGNSSEKKVALIESSDYLRATHGRLQSTGGHLFTYGWSFSRPDWHIVSTILDSQRFESVSIGVYRDDAELVARIDEYQACLPRRPRIYFYDAESALVWSKGDPVYEPAPNVLPGRLVPRVAW